MLQFSAIRVRAHSDDAAGLVARRQRRINALSVDDPPKPRGDAGVVLLDAVDVEARVGVLPADEPHRVVQVLHGLGDLQPVADQVGRHLEVARHRHRRGQLIGQRLYGHGPLRDVLVNRQPDPVRLRARLPGERTIYPAIAWVVRAAVRPANHSGIGRQDEAHLGVVQRVVARDRHRAVEPKRVVDLDRRL